MKYYSVASFRVEDYKRFKNEFDSAQDLLRTAGFKRSYINRDLNDPTHLIVVHECEDVQKARDFYASPEFTQCVTKAGIIGEPTVTFMEELVRTPELVSV